ncbi:hypothetical protein D3C84_1025470 [compost metagenome]
MRSNDHHPLLTQIAAWNNPQLPLIRQTAITSAQAQLPCSEQFAQSRQIKVTQARDSALEGLAIIATQQHRRVKESPQPAAFQAKGQDQSFTTSKLQGRLHLHHAINQLDPVRHALRGKLILVVLSRRIEQVIGKPGFMGAP